MTIFSCSVRISPWTGWLNNTYHGVITARACASVNVCAEAVTAIVTTAAATTSSASLFIASSPSGSLLADPVSDVGRAVENVAASGLTASEETNNLNVDAGHFFEVQRHRPSALLDLTLDFAQMLGLHSTDQSNRRAAPIRIPFDPQRHVRRAPRLVTPAGPIPAPSAVLRSPRSCWGWVGLGIANRAPDGKSSLTAIYLADPAPNLRHSPKLRRSSRSFWVAGAMWGGTGSDPGSGD